MKRSTFGWMLVRVSAAGLLLAYLLTVLPIDLRGPAAWTALLVAPCYLLVHALRALRLFLIFYDGNLRLRDALFAHLHSAGVSALIPFKLGEIYRVAVLYATTGLLARALIAAWIERVFDTLLVMALLGLIALLIGPAAVAGAQWFLPVACVFLFVSFFLFLVLPENIAMIKRHLITKHHNPIALRALTVLDRLHKLLAEAGVIWRSRFATILWLSLFIWMLEVGTIVALVGLLGGGSDMLAASAPIISDITVRSSPWSESTVSSVWLAYRLGTVDILTLLALLLALTWRFGSRPPTSERKENAPCA